MSTIQEIAARLGVSRHTVSRVLRGETRGAWATTAERARRIRELAVEMGYRPNASARALVLGKFGCVGLLLSTIRWHSYLNVLMLEAIDEALTKRNIHLSVARLPDENLVDQTYVPKILREWLCDGLLINYNAGIPKRLIDNIREHNIPSIWLNSRFDHDCVYLDELAAGAEATRRVIAAGHRRIAYADYAFSVTHRYGHNHYSQDDRRAGYELAMKEAGLTPVFIHDDPDREHRNFMKHVADVFSSADRPTALVTYSEKEAGLTREVLSHQGLCVPEDVSQVTFRGDTMDILEYWDQSVMEFSEREIAETAVAMLVEKLDAPARSIRSSAIAFTWHPGRTLLSLSETRRKK